jgi:F-box-like
MASARIHLLELPDEILLAIISHIPDRKDLRSLVCASRRTNDLAEPFLYDSIEVVNGSQAAALSKGITSRKVRATWIRSLLVSTRFGEDQGLNSLPPQISLMRNLRDVRLETPDCNIKPAHLRIPWVQLQERYERIFENSSLLVPAAERYLPHLRSCSSL